MSVYVSFFQFFDCILTQFNSAEVAKRHTEPVSQLAGAHTGQRFIEAIEQRSFFAFGANGSQDFQTLQRSQVNLQKFFALTSILESKPYRGKDVFSITKHFSGAIAQVLDQKDNLMKDFNNTCKGTELEAFNPRCIIVIGKLASLSKNQRKSFELFRSSCKEVHIVTFDEVCQKIENLLSILAGKEQKK